MYFNFQTYNHRHNYNTQRTEKHCLAQTEIYLIFGEFMNHWTFKLLSGGSFGVKTLLHSISTKRTFLGLLFFMNEELQVKEQNITSS